MASSAAAKPGYFELPPSAGVEFTVHGSHGSTIDVEGIGKRIEITVHPRGSGGLAIFGSSATYQVPGRAGQHGIEANLGSLGRIDLRFDPISIKHEPGPKICHGRPTLAERGALRGTMRFRGERSYTRFSSHRIRATAWRGYRQICKWPHSLFPGSGEKSPPPSEEDEEGKREIKSLNAAMSSRHRSVTFRFVSLLAPPPPLKPEFALVLAKAKVEEQRGPISIEREALIPARPRALRLAPAGQSPAATLTLPRPFAGEAIYDPDTPGKPDLSGTLRVDLPGADRVALTGPGFVAALCRSGTLEADFRCERPVSAEAKRGPDL